MNDLFLDLSDTKKKAELTLDIITDNDTVKDQRTTTICDDGIVFRDKNYVFGMGSGPYSTYNTKEDGTGIAFDVNEIGKVEGGTLNDSEPFMFMYENDADNYDFIIKGKDAEGNETATSSNLLKYGMDNAGYDLYIRKFPLRKLFEMHDKLNVIMQEDDMTIKDLIDGVVDDYGNALKAVFDKKIEEVQKEAEASNTALKQANNELVVTVSNLQTELQNQQLAYTALAKRYDEQYTILNNRIDSFTPSITDSDANPSDSGDSGNND
jgi:hypothetical protein